MKQCIDCKNTKPLSEFNYTEPRPGKRYPRKRCKPCQNSHQSQLRAKRFTRDPGKRVKYLANKREQRMAKYGLMEKEYQARAKSQGYRCLICGKKKKLYVDHDHNTGSTRGLLCSDCNTALGLIQEEIATMERMIDYIQVHSC